MAENDPILREEDKPSPRPRRVKCEFCECELAVSGDVLKVSEQARKYRKLAEENESLEGTIATLRGEIERLTVRPEPEPAPKPEPEPKRKKGFFF